VISSFTSISSSSKLLPVLCSITGEGIPPVSALLIADEKISSYSLSVSDVMVSIWNKCCTNTNEDDICFFIIRLMGVPQMV